MKNHQPLLERGEVFGVVKTGLDAHTLGISVIQQLLEDCGVRVVVADNGIATAIERRPQAEQAGVIRAWILANNITRLGFSYRLDPGQAVACFARLVYQIDSDSRLAAHRGGSLRAIAFAGLPAACEGVERLFPGRFCLFRGDETPRETLGRLGVPSTLVPASLTEESAYAETLLAFGLQDVIKARTLLRLVGMLADQDFRILYQPRAGLDFFSPDLEKAKVQLAAVTALMSDVDPAEGVSPPIIHVVSYSEGAHLADPTTIDESVQIARAALQHFPSFRQSEGLEEALSGGEIEERVEALWLDATRMIGHIEAHIGEISTPQGLYRVLQSGYIPLPYLWSAREEFPAAIRWTTRAGSRGVAVVDERGAVLGIEERLALIETRRA